MNKHINTRGVYLVLQLHIRPCELTLLKLLNNIVFSFYLRHISYNQLSDFLTIVSSFFFSAAIKLIVISKYFFVDLKRGCSALSTFFCSYVFAILKYVL